MKHDSRAKIAVVLCVAVAAWQTAQASNVTNTFNAVTTNIVYTGGQQTFGYWIGDGSGDSFNALIITNTAMVTNAPSSSFSTLQVGFGHNSGANNNVGTVTGNGSVWFITNAFLYVGNSGLTNTLTVSAGAHLAVVTNNTAHAFDGGQATLRISAGSGASNNILRVSGLGSTVLTVGGGLTLGAGTDSGQNQLILTDGAVMTNDLVAAVGTGSRSSGNSVTVGGGNNTSRWVLAWTGNASSAIGSGFNANSNTVTVTTNGVMQVLDATSNQGLMVGAQTGASYSSLIVTNGGQVSVSSCIGIGSTVGTGVSMATGNLVRVVGAGSLLQVAQKVGIGSFSSFSNRLEVADGGVASIGGTVTLSATNNLLIVTAGGQVTNVPSLNLLGQANQVTVSGNNSSLWLSDKLYQGGGASFNNVLVADGALLNVASNIFLGTSNDPGGPGTGNVLRVTGPGAEVQVPNGAVNAGPMALAISNRVEVFAGGLLEANSLKTGTGLGNLITNAGGIFQFTQTSVTVTPGTAGSIAIANGTVSFRNVATGLNLTNNWKGSPLTNITWSGFNALRLDSSTATNTLAGGYTFDQSAGNATNYYRLELINGTTAVTGNGITVGSAGSMLVSNSRASISGPFTNAGTVTFFHSVGTFNSAVVNSGAWVTDPSTNVFLSNYSLTSTGYVQMAAGDLFIFKSNFVNQSTQSTSYNTLAGKFLFDGSGLTQTFATAAADLGPGGPYQSPLNQTNALSSRFGLGPSSNNFALGTLEIFSGSTVEVANASANDRGALYLENLWIDPGAFLIVSNNVSVYFHNSNSWSLANNVTLLSGAELHQLIPEPSTLLLITIGGLAIVWGRRRQTA